jgi:hypothetical protein
VHQCQYFVHYHSLIVLTLHVAFLSLVVQASSQAQPAVTASAAQEAAAIDVLTAQGSTVAAAQHLNAAQLPELPQQEQQQEAAAVSAAAATAAAAVQQQALSAAEQLKAQQAREQELRNSRFLQQKAELTEQIRAAAERVNT